MAYSNNTVHDDILNAAIDPQKWQTVLQKILGKSSSQGGVLGMRNREGVKLIQSSGLSTNYFNNYFSIADNANLMMQFYKHFKEGQITTEATLSVMMGTPFIKSDFYNLVARPEGLRFGVVGYVSLNNEERIIFSTARESFAGPYTQDEIKYIKRHLPTLRQAVIISQHLEHNNLKLKAAETFIDQLNAGILLVNHKSQIIYHNLIVESLLQNEDGIKLVSNNVVTGSKENSRAQLTEKVTALAKQTYPKPLETINLQRNIHGKHSLQLTMFSLKQDEPLFSGNSASVCILIIDPSRRQTAPNQLWQLRYNLTPAEIALVQELINGHNLREASERRNIRYETARTHLKNIFNKTGANSQVKLLQILLNDIAALFTH